MFRRPSSAGGGFLRGCWLCLDELYEPEPRSLPALSRSELELVRELANDRDPETTFVEPILTDKCRFGDREPRAVVAHLDDEPVGMELVDDLDRALAPVTVGVPDRVGARLGNGEFETAQCLVRNPPRLGEPAQREPYQGDVFRLGGDRQADGGSATVCGRSLLG